MSFVLPFVIILLVIVLKIPFVIGQIDLGSFSLGQDKRGDLKVGFNQGANIFGFGGDRGLDFTIGEGRFDTKARQGALIAGERIGLDSGLGLNEAEGVNFGSILNFGKNPISSNNPAGQLLSFLENIGKFFTSGGKPLEPPPSSLQPNIQTEDGFRNFGTKQRKISGETIDHMQSENVNDNDYYRNIEEEVTEEELKTTTESSVELKPTTESSGELKTIFESSEELKTTTESSGELKTTFESSEELKPTTESSGELKTTFESSEELKTTTESSEELKAAIESSVELKPTTESSVELKPTTESSGELKATIESSGGLIEAKN